MFSKLIITHTRVFRPASTTKDEAQVIAGLEERGGNW
jgi:hypothetical protein